ncbi:WD40/YVTN/BNR-like repeat-containing protein [Neolewinella agarilytica]|uniref:Sortilin N-terminal domain-containing protein n=1 Tax=Neolewinella agarilytica TaxID=478744 RepID=A0A1H9HTW9_9BACT|nr:glycosyl hydrolase [Neolewinella agarilytica]SEQ65760.1 Uncharacterized protein SAMN05444359_113102 [Neolewinella agarilytica]
MLLRHFLLFGCLLLSSTLFAQSETNPKSKLDAVKYRHVGPFRGGRANDAVGVPGDPMTYYMGNTGGGVWKTEDAGQHWSNISDGFFGSSSIGALAVAASNPNIVYCGTGEHAVRGVMTSSGDGVYKSTDAGKTWKKIGLENSRHIARIVVHPTDEDIVYVAVQGSLYGPSKERGIYKTTDGGKNWKQILAVDERTGCSELSMVTSNPLILYATMWEYGRKPWQVISGGPGSGVYKSTDGGESWNKIQDGLPKELGKMAISVAQSNPDKVYLLAESDSEKQLGGLFVSNDAGGSWSRVSGDHRLIQRAWYYIEVFADPNNENTVYVLSAPMLKSIDGGKNWEVMSGPHGDYHNLWINPKNSKNMVVTDDGGCGITYNGGKSWSRQDNMPTVQIYRLNVDNHFPYRLYGGQQDNTSVRLESRDLRGGGIGPRAMTPSAGGESAFLAFDPDDPSYVLGGSYLGTIGSLDTKTSTYTNIMSSPIQYLALDAKDMKYRFNWNAPIIWSQHEPNTYYHAAQVLLRTRDRGKSWEEVSPDLTRNEKEKQGKGGVPYTNESVGAESYGTIAYVMESPHEKGVIWTGSDDGLVQLTRDGGKNWKNVTPTGLAECLVNAIEVSPHDPATAYIATTRYKFDDHKPGLYVTHNYGKSWSAINAGIPDGAFTRVIREDDKVKDLLFAGTETGVYVSQNGGKQWDALQLNLPVTPITDMAVRHDDLILSTAGRGFWILDDLGLIRQRPAPKSSMHLYDPEPAALVGGYSQLNGNNPGFKGSHPLRGVNPANGLVIYYQLPAEKDSSELMLEIRDGNGELIRSFSSVATGFSPWDGGPGRPATLSAKPGLNRFVWDLRHAPLIGVNQVYIEGSYRGHKVPAGDYQLILKRGSTTRSTTAEVLPHPLLKVEPEAAIAYDKHLKGMAAELNKMHLLTNQLFSAAQQLSAATKKLPKSMDADQLRKQAAALSKELKAWDELMVQRKSKAYDDVENYVNGFTADYLFLLNQSENNIGQIGEPSLNRMQELNAQWAKYEQTGEVLMERLEAFNKRLWAMGVGAIQVKD